MCGAVRYELKSEPFDSGWCHCRTCQLFSGAPAMAFTCVPREDFMWTAGEERVRWVDTSSFGRRAFCSECGSPLQVQVNHQPETLDFPIVTLDDRDAFAPEFHIFWSRKVAWFNPGDEVQRHDRFRPNTRGLNGTEPPDNSSMSGGGGR